MKIGSLFSGIGGLDLAVEQFFGAKTVWHSEIEPGPSKVLAARCPGVPNLGDITRVDWSQVEPVDIITGGSPCQDLSGAGRRSGMTEGTRSNLWVQMREAIAVLKPQIVVWENVRGAYSATADSGVEQCPGCVGGSGDGEPSLRALGRVLGDLADLGFDAEWVGLRASDVGAAHGRFRVFVVAYDPVRYAGHRAGRAKFRLESQEPTGWPGQSSAGTPVIAHARHGAAGWESVSGEASLGRSPAVSGGSCGAHAADPVTLLPTPDASVANDGEELASWLARREVVKLTARNGNGMGMPLAIAAKLFPTPKASDGEWGTPRTSGRPIDKATHLGTITTLLPTPRAHDYAAAMGSPGAARHVASGNGSLAEVIGVHLEPLPGPGSVAEYETLWASLEDQSPFWVTDKGVDYWPAISRWADVMGRKSPSPTVPDGRDGRHRLNPAFAEWLMGLPAGWADGLTRNERLKAFGNGVVPQQAFAALSAAVGRFW